MTFWKYVVQISPGDRTKREVYPHEQEKEIREFSHADFHHTHNGWKRKRRTESVWGNVMGQA